ncbi:hypothetical protein DRE_03388 [Drechslerella stenobrocha 248]|uniref:Riboflavin synthase n=1 Tax=Drechslerella stenobrocha 248 TaxID=1043628 RepID=W7HUS3_9PEZI|nr:hypothetical protein DRE_03388 [Drechslerella stenobrocha 248]
MSPRIRLESVVDEGDCLAITWALKEWDVPDEDLCDPLALSVKFGDLEGVENCGRDALSEIEEDVSSLEEVLKLLEENGILGIPPTAPIDSSHQRIRQRVSQRCILNKETIGTVSELLELDSSSSGGNGCSMTISGCAEILSDALLGDSICVNGTCLTITSLSDDRTAFKLGIAPETLRRTNLGQLKVNSRVNLERAMSTSSKLAQPADPGTTQPLPPNSRFGGHMVQGHVDSTATITKKVADGNAVSFTFKLADEHKDLMRYIVEKGFITVDGASLTVTHVNDNTAEFGVMLIAYTQEKVVTAAKEVGELVNVEADQVGKYVEKSVLAFLGGEGSENKWLTNFVEEIVERKVKSLQQK